MNLGKRVLTRIDNQVKECSVIKIEREDLTLKDDEGNIVIRKFWEIRTIPYQS